MGKKYYCKSQSFKDSHILEGQPVSILPKKNTRFSFLTFSETKNDAENSFSGINSHNLELKKAELSEPVYKAHEPHVNDNFKNIINIIL